MTGISFIVPTLNEAGTISQLILRVHSTATSMHVPYEIVVVDDNSRDGTDRVVTGLSREYPVGKASSLLYGFKKARYPILCMIDADLQYDPESIPTLLSKLKGSVGVVVGNRSTKSVEPRRKFLMSVYRNLFGTYLHGFHQDVMSGLKVIKKEVIERINLHPYPWSFDIELLVKARNAGYTIASASIPFNRRDKQRKFLGQRPISLWLKMVLHAFNLAFSNPDIVPFHPNQEKVKGKGFHYEGVEFIHHSDLSHHENAFFRLSLPQVFVLSFIVGIAIVGILMDWHATVVVVFAILTVLYFVDLLFNLFLIYRSFSKPPEIVVSKKEIGQIIDTDWPIYTILCPLYKEWRVVPQFISAMQKLDYPEDKLQILLLLEEDDTETIEKVRTYTLPKHFQTIIVPHSNPKTKPKALNYALQFAKGTYSVIFDAEDVPDSDQLKKTVLAFHKVDSRTVCIQAKLNFYNPHQNILTRVFTAEYSLWFDLVLTGLQSINAPIPLGGTSNHFKTEELRKIRGWDAFNVTEDCDLGIRLVKQGYRTAIVDSTTLEEANSSLGNWFRQRSRWIKGYMQTYLVHMRNPGEFLTHWKDPHVVTFQMVVGGKILSMFINPTMWTITILYFTIRPVLGEFIESFFPPAILYMGVFSLIFGNFLYLYYYMIGCAKREHYDLIKYAFLVPLYWLAMSIAAWIAFYELLFRPHYWQKTKHGLHLTKEKLLLQQRPALSSAQL
ncbi:glycosyltransferase [Candidatus Roizmanbacteria bacterium]|nr:glycosyltransferase [Candidatus Roizmanbacteria bacterium]